MPFLFLTHKINRENASQVGRTVPVSRVGLGAPSGRALPNAQAFSYL